MADFYGFNPPFIGGPQNILSRQEDERLIKNDILQLLLTLPGERLNRPGFGTQLRSFIFEPNTIPDLQNLQNSIANAIEEYEPRVNLTKLDLTPLSDGHTLRVVIIARLTNDPNTEIIIDRLINNS
jgi:phage baseplate assembly protein W